MNQISTALLLLLPALLLAGCNSMTPNYDARFGEAVRDAKRQMTINPNAGLESESKPEGMDGVAAHQTMQRYQQSFKSPPPVVNVINIGGGIGGGGGGGGGSQ
jgi:hypothetical protein